MEKKNNKIEERLSELVTSYREGLPVKLDELRQCWSALCTDSWNEPLAERLLLMLHNLAGSGATYGFSDLSAYARGFERLLETVVKQRSVSTDVREQVDLILDSLKQSSISSDDDPFWRDFVGMQRNQPRFDAESRTVLINLPGEKKLEDEVAAQLERQGYRVIVMESGQAVEAWLLSERPLAVVLAELPEKEGLYCEAMDELNRSGNCPPSILISARGDAESRLAAARTGVNRYLTTPLDSLGLIEALDDFAQEASDSTGRVLIVDDDANIATLYRTFLEQAGMEVKHLTNPVRALETIESFDPDLIVMDLNMPQCNGMECASVIRQFRHLDDIPILYVAGYGDDNLRLEAMSRGGEEFLDKPIDPYHLIRTVRAWLVRSGRVRRQKVRAENNLRELERQKFALDQHSIVSIAESSGKITYANEKFVQISGYSLDDLLGENHNIVNSGTHSKSFFIDMWQTIASGKVWHGELSNRAKDGAIYWVDSTIVPYMDERGVPYQYVSIRTDITERKLLHEELQKNENRLNRSQTFANIGTWDWNIETGALYWSERIAPLFGYQDQLVDTTYENFVNAIHPDDRDAVLGAVNACVEEGAEYNIEHRVVWGDGTVHWLLEKGDVVRDEAGTALKMLGVVQDVTARKEAEEALNRFKTTLDVTQDCVFMFDPESLTFFYANQGAIDQVGYSEQELLAMHPWTIKPGYDERKFRSLIEPLLLEGQGSITFETIHEHKDGSLIPVDIVLQLIAPEGEPTRFVAIVRNVTERKRSEAALQASRNMMQSVLDTIPVRVFWKDRESVYLGCNNHFAADAGIKHPQEIVGKTDLELPWPEQAELYRADDAMTISNEESKLNYEEPQDRSDGSRNWVETSKVPLRDGEGEIIGVLGTYHDITDRKLAEKALQVSEARLRDAQRIGHIGNWSWDVESGYLHWSDEIFRIFGRSPGEFEPTYEHFFETIHPDDVERIKHSEEEAFAQGKKHSIDHRIVMPDGEIRWVHEEAEAVMDEDGNPISLVGTVQDITDRKRADIELERQKVLFESLFRDIPDAMVFADPERVVQMCNPALTRVFGYQADEVVGEKTSVLYESEAEFFRQGEQRFNLSATESRLPYEVAYQRKDGDVFPGETVGTAIKNQQGETIGFIDVIRDITDRKEAEQNLEIFRQVFDTSKQGIGIADRDGKLIYINKAHEAYHGYRAEEVIGRHFQIFMGDETYKNMWPKIVAAIDQGKSWSGLLPELRKDGSEFVTFSNISFVPGDDGKPQYLFNIFDDYTDELARQQELNLAKEQAEQANRAKSEFLSSMSHELRTPMNAILGFAQLLEMEGAQLSKDHLDNVSEIVTAGQHLLELINEVLDLARIEAGRIELNMESVVIRDVLEEAKTLISPLAEKRGIKLIDTLNCGSRISVRADRVRLKQVLINLLSNAVKYNREGGHINLSCGCDSDSRDQVCLTVGDTGKGIPFEQIESLFTPFNRLGAETSGVEGTGIGLVITKQLVEMMGGEVGCESTPGEGSQFTVSFPLDESLADEHEDVSNSDEEAQARVVREYSVLYVEDNPANIRLMNAALARRANVNLMTAHTAELGLDLAEAHQPDVIILDINLPGISGMEALERIKVSEKLCNTPVIALSADAMQSSIDRGLEAGFYRYLTKPIDIQALFESLDASIEAAREQ